MTTRTPHAGKLNQNLCTAIQYKHVGLTPPPPPLHLILLVHGVPLRIHLNVLCNIYLEIEYICIVCTVYIYKHVGLRLTDKDIVSARGSPTMLTFKKLHPPPPPPNTAGTI